MPEPTTYVLDSWPILEWMQKREPSFSFIDQLLDRAVAGEIRLLMSEINYGEVLYSCWRIFPANQAGTVLADLETLPIDYIPVDLKTVEMAAQIKAKVAAAYADCFTAALAIRQGAPLITGDRELLEVGKLFPLQLHWLGA